MLIFSNPRMYFQTHDWPYGNTRALATFSIEQSKRGERVIRETINPTNGRFNKPKKTTYTLKARIVDGSDGRTYIAELSDFGHITIRESNLKYEHAVIYPRDHCYQELLTLFNEVD